MIWPKTGNLLFPLFERAWPLWWTSFTVFRVGVGLYDNCIKQYYLKYYQVAPLLTMERSLPVGEGYFRLEKVISGWSSSTNVFILNGLFASNWNGYNFVNPIWPSDQRSFEYFLFEGQARVKLGSTEEMKRDCHVGKYYVAALYPGCSLHVV